MASVHNILPDHALDAEDAVLCACMVDLSTLTRHNLRPEQFFGRSGQVIVGALWHFAEQGYAEVPVETLVDHLRRVDRLREIGGTGEVARLLNAVPTATDLAPLVRTVQESWKVRALDGLMGQLRSQCRSHTGNRADLIRQVRRAIDDATADTGSSDAGIPLMDAGDVPPEIPEIPFVCERLHLAPGRPVCLVGYAGAGKTMLAYDLALAVAARPEKGLTFWGGLKVDRHGEVIVLDLEVGGYLTKQRLLQLAAGKWGQLTDWTGRLAFASFPRWSLLSTGAEAVLEATLRGKTLCIIDSLAAITPGVDENAKTMADHMALLARVSEKTGCSILVLHHEGKPSQEGPKAVHLRGRGSSAIQGIWSSQWAVTSLGEGRLQLEHGKSQWGALQPSHSCQIADVWGDDGRTKLGVRLAPVEATTASELAPEGPGALQRVKREAMEALGAFGEMAGAALVAALKGKKDTKYRALKELQEEGRILRTPEGKGAKFSLVSPRGTASGGQHQGDSFHRWGDDS
jgi:hypothetical protein